VKRLEEEGLELREDSVLCNSFIEDKTPMRDVEKTVQTMKMMDILHKNDLRERWQAYKSDFGWMDKEEYQEEYESFKQLLFSAIVEGNVEKFPKA